MTADENRVLWITGAATGVGAATARLAARSGWRVAASGRRRDALHDVADEILNAGGHAAVFPLDVTRRDTVDSAARGILATYGRIDALVAAAGANTSRRTWADQEMSAFDEVVATNLTGAASAIAAAMPQLRKRGGTVVLVSSIAAWTAIPAAGVAYSASKSALASLVRDINVQEAGSGVRACHLCPGDIDTDFLLHRPVVPDADARARMLTPSDVARVVQFVLDSPPHVRLDEIVLSPL